MLTEMKGDMKELRWTFVGPVGPRVLAYTLQDLGTKSSWNNATA
jgi:hypothetical protein